MLLLLHIRSAMRISKYSGFLSGCCFLNTGIFLSGLKPRGESRTQQVLLVSKRKIGGNYACFRANHFNLEKNAIHCLRTVLYFKLFTKNVVD